MTYWMYDPQMPSLPLFWEMKKNKQLSIAEIFVGNNAARQ